MPQNSTGESTEKPVMNKTKKSQLTRQNILQSALILFRNEGYENTTIRDIAKKAKIALGTIYIYYASKEEIVLEYYTKKQNDLYRDIQNRFYGEPETVKNVSNKTTKARSMGLAESIKLLFETQLKTLQPDKHFLSGLAGAAATAGSSVSPFSKSASDVRNIHIRMLEEIVENSKDKIDPSVKKELPGLLWFLQMGIIFYWLHDTSKNSKYSLELVNTLTNILESLIKLQNNPFASSFKKTFIELSKELMNIIKRDGIDR